MPEGLHHGDWRGVFLHKNALGNYMAIINIIFLVSFRKNYRPILSVIGYLLSWILIFGSGSKTSIASTIFIHVIMLFLFFVKNQKLSFRFILWIISVPVFLIIFLIFIYYEKIAVSLGGTETLTGRIPLWFGVFQAIGDTPLFGYGYAAFWGNESGSLKYLTDSEWISGKSHNAFMDIWLDLGIIGLIMFIGFLGTTFIKLLYLYRQKGNLYHEGLLLILILIISVSMLDFRILYYNSIVFFLVVYIYFYTNSVSKRKRAGWKLVRIKGY
jgi:O-antigen ligase